jgi:hypothetical protein
MYTPAATKPKPPPAVTAAAKAPPLAPALELGLVYKIEKNIEYLLHGSGYYWGSDAWKSIVALK